MFSGCANSKHREVEWIIYFIPWFVYNYLWLKVLSCNVHNHGKRKINHWAQRASWFSWIRIVWNYRKNRHRRIHQRLENGVLHFKLLDPSHPEYNEQDQRFTEYSQKEIKNSFGEIENRYVIKTLIRIGAKQIKALISLSDREKMRYPVLIGRRFLKNRFIVDVSLLNNLELNSNQFI